MTATTHDFRYRSLDEIDHRPWEMPRRPWVMTQTWHDLLFVHWPVSAVELRRLVPAPCDLDLFDGQAWLGVVPFEMTNVAPRACPALPRVSAFGEINVRTYVRVNGRPGVYFLSLDAGSRLAVTVARTLFHLPYYNADFEITRDASGTIGYRAQRRAGTASFAAQYAPVERGSHPAARSLEYFLTERYCLYTVTPAGRCRRVDIHHPAWFLHRAAADLRVNTMTLAAGLRVPDTAPLLHYARRQDVVNWLPVDAGGRTMDAPE
ncbi:MAG TPA: DUF2071 domain-containing protein [Vicinamibacterales bacterium]|jgi:hypothetical protein